MKKYLMLMGACSISACSSVAVDHSALQNGSHRLSVQGDKTSGQQQLLAHIEKKAAAICGQNAYRIEGDSPIQATTVPKYVDGSYVDITSYNLVRTVWCE
ncbi:MAG: hypothetical protein KJP25_08420 [Gammaproteobacteria bacterium]|nr:hypothetical protein [Gammaproteobacteria bacterium]MBT8150006.1 hypothetical protein [Gammaproteobacteria bacterium]NND40138.1 hypothetical protein [Pseudomonadales bacterium]RZV49574.1 MAG: hypothetical protein EX270_12430 [Pseudomonadales bacterium]